MTFPSALAGYSEDAADLIRRFEAIAAEDVLSPVIECLPNRPCHVLEVGAGTGRDAAWLAGQGHQVVAVEPVDALRHAGMALHPSPNLVWLDDRLPGLERVRAGGESFDLVLLVAVWQHLPPDLHEPAVTALASVTASGGRLILSLRHGPGSPSRPCFPASADRLVAAAASVGLSLRLRRTAPSVQQKNRDAGVTWTWLCLERPVPAKATRRTPRRDPRTASS